MKTIAPGHIPTRPALATLACALLLATPALTQAQIKTQPDGRWRQILGAGASFADGNSNLSSMNAHYEAARQTRHHTVGLRAQALYNTSDHKTSAHNTNLEINGKRNLNERHYIFANGTWFRDRIANLEHRLSAATGWGYQVTTTPHDDWSLFAGIGYSEDRYAVPTIVADQLRKRYGRAELTLGTESHHQLTSTTTAHQRLVFYPALNRNHDRRAEFAADLSVDHGASGADRGHRVPLQQRSGDERSQAGPAADHGGDLEADGLRVPGLSKDCPVLRKTPPGRGTFMEDDAGWESPFMEDGSGWRSPLIKDDFGRGGTGSGGFGQPDPA